MSQDNTNKLKRRIGPGIWEDMNGHIHWSLPELCALVDLEYNEENKAAIIEMLQEDIGKHCDSAKMIYRSSPEDKGQEL